MKPIIEIKNLGKRYSIAHQRGGYIALRDVLSNIIRRPFAFLKSKAKKAVGLEKTEDFWALKNISLDVMPGEIIGIIGRNGAGKSTLLKILSGITPPTEGEIIMHGKVASLLEVGTGFHPELTGRENIFLNGAILGMTRKEIARKFDEIVAFAGIEQFLDTPVKHYSSGMYVRLAFSVAAHMEPDILIVDEVLAVGDADFQKKCLGKMEEVTKQEGRTILFVSHNLGAIQNLCQKTALLKKGAVVEFGETEKVIKQYLNDQNLGQTDLVPDPHKDVSFTKIWVTDANDNVKNLINIDDDFKIWTKFNVKKETDKVEISIVLRNSNGVNVIFTSISDSNNHAFVPFTPGEYTVAATFKKNLLMPDNYSVTVTAHERGVRRIDFYGDTIGLTIIDTGNTAMSPYGPGGRAWACIVSENKWEIVAHEQK